MLVEVECIREAEIDGIVGVSYQNFFGVCLSQSFRFLQIQVSGTFSDFQTRLKQRHNSYHLNRQFDPLCYNWIGSM